jgi:transketolase
VFAVGIAIAEAHLAARFNRPGHEIIDRFTSVLSGDGYRMEGVATDACWPAGTTSLS